MADRKENLPQLRLLHSWHSGHDGWFSLCDLRHEPALNHSPWPGDGDRVSHKEQTMNKTEAVAPDQDQKQRLLHEDELSTVNGGFGFVEHAMTTVIKSIGEALSTVARKQ